MKRDGERCARRKERGRADGWAVVTRWENPATPASATCQRRGPPGGRGEKRRRHGAHGHQDRPGGPLGRSPQGPAVESKRQEDKRSRKCDGRVQPRMERTLPPSQAMAGRRRDHTPRKGDGNSAPRPFPILWRFRAKAARVNGCSAQVMLFKYEFISNYVLSENLAVILSVIWFTWRL